MGNFADEVRSYHDNHIKMGAGTRLQLRERRDKNIARLKDGIRKLGSKRDTVYALPLRTPGQGSYSTRTLVQQGSADFDIDVALIFREEDLPSSALEARKRIRDALLETGVTFKKEPEARTNAVTVWYNDGYHVDFAVYRERENLWGSKFTEHAGPDWAKRDAMDLTNWVNKYTKAESQRVRVVRLTKALAKLHDSPKPPGGLILTVLAIDNFVGRPEKDDESLLDTWRGIIRGLRSTSSVRNPATPGESLTTRQTDCDRVQRFAEKLKWAVGLVEDAETKVDEAHAWAEIFPEPYWHGVVDATPKDTATEALKSSRLGDLFSERPSFHVGAYVERGGCLERYSPGTSVRKGLTLQFKVEEPTHIPDGTSFRWIVRNSGPEAVLKRDTYRVEGNTGSVQDEHTGYTGLHSITCKMLRRGREVGRVRIPVRVQ